MKCKTFFLLLSAFLFATTALAQTDTTFWFAAPEVTESAGWGNFDRPLALRISTLGQAATITVSIPANAAVAPRTLTVAANSSGSIDLTPWIDLIEARPTNTVLNKGIKISATAPVNVYYENISGLNTACQCSPEIFVLKGRNALGRDFIIPSQNILQNGNAYNPPSYNSFDIVATENNTTVTITPKAAVVGHPAGVPFTVTLNSGQVFSNTATNFFPANHLTGSRVSSNKPIAITVKDDMVQGPACWDLGGDQIIPTDNLSTEYIAVRGYLTSLTDHVFITAVNNNTAVTINGVAYATLGAAQTIAVPFTALTMYISATDKVYAFQLSGFGCEVGLSTIPSITCRGSSSVSFTRSSAADLILLVTTRAGNEGSFSLNGAPLAASSFSYVPATANQWMYARLTIPVSQIPALAAGRMTNASGVFHLGIIHGSTASGGARFGYFSDYAAPVLNVLPDSIKTCADTLVLNAGTGYAAYNWNTGATTPAITAAQNGLYQLAVTTPEGCILRDSGYVKLDKLVRYDSTAKTICSGQSFMLPWGAAVTMPGLYRDTLRYQSGCDSIRRTVNLTVLSAVVQAASAAICAGQTYTLPWGQNVAAAGLYQDTIRTGGGCDSVIRRVQLSVQSSTTAVSSIQLCQGQSHTLPWGQVVTMPGIYSDTTRYSPTGCDSLVRRMTVLVRATTLTALNASICSGQPYVLPWGAVVTTAGTYADTLRYTAGCDSVINQVHLTTKPVSRVSRAASFCEGGSYTLPWGLTATAGGTYADTLFYASGCDSLINTILLTAIKTVYDSVQKSICPAQPVTLPSGVLATLPGIYHDTVRSQWSGCDSIITHITLLPGAPPVITLKKSNDISCGVGTSRLSATGGSRYEWSPAGTLDNAYVSNPVASPATSTVYRVTVTNTAGCSATDSITLQVNLDRTAQSFSVPSAFTPNADGRNDCFSLRHWGAVKNFRLRIYNRWGQSVFASQNPADCWNAAHVTTTAVFVYQVWAESLCGTVYQKGTVTVIK